MPRARTLLTIPAVLLGLACSDASAPSLVGPDYFSILLDGHAWTPDTVTGVFYFVTPDTGTLNLYATRATSTTIATVALSIRLPLASQTFPLADTSSAAVGTYVQQALFPPQPTRALVYTSTAANPGNLIISTFSPGDSVLVGEFAFEAAATPDTAGHHTISGRFRAHYFRQQVFLAPH